jgi:hypothetical protein
MITMLKLVALTRQRNNGSWKQTDYFIVEDFVVEPEKAMRDAIKEYLLTDSGKKMIRYSCDDYNWGDAVNSVDNEIWEKHGIKIKYDNQEYTISGEIIDITVNQDEILIPEEYYESEIV